MLCMNQRSYIDGWDGLTPRGKEAEDGVYFWKVIYEDVYGKPGIKHGNLTLVRE